MDSVNESAFLSVLVVTLPTGIATLSFGPTFLGRSVIALTLGLSLMTIALTLLMMRDAKRGRWKRTGLVFLISGMVIGLGSIEMIVALLLALVVIDILLGSFTGSEHLVNMMVRWSTPRSK